MTLRKDDPVYYKYKIGKLMKQAQEEGLVIDVDADHKGVTIYFRADNGESAAIGMLKRN